MNCTAGSGPNGGYGDGTSFPGRALDAYRKWGAAAKADHLRNACGPDLVAPPPREVPPEAEPEKATDRSASANWMDINSLMKAGRALTQTVQLPDLLAEMIKILLENAGAEEP